MVKGHTHPYLSYPLHAILFPPQLTMSHRSICTVFSLFSTPVIVTAAVVETLDEDIRDEGCFKNKKVFY